ncbi:MAG: hypothetical protein HGA61_03005 [Candidatus Moranbacteria bacterium]|nr:hypothetical protein [Candidatus Moranbacteria bacterium]
MINSIPEKFKEFKPVFQTLSSLNPKSVSIVGSYGDSNKTPSDSSDLDAIFVFDKSDIRTLYGKCLLELNKINNLEVVELGVHAQFGYVFNIYFKDNPLKWIDLGIMDVNFSENYLSNLPKTDIFGHTDVSKDKPSAIAHMNQLSRKIIVALRKKDYLTLTTFCFRYLGWWKVYSRINKLRNQKKGVQCQISTDDFINNLYQTYTCSMSTEIIVSFVLKDIAERFPALKDEVDDGIPFEEKISVLTTELKGQMEKEQELNEEIKKQLGKIGIKI